MTATPSREMVKAKYLNQLDDCRATLLEVTVSFGKRRTSLDPPLNPTQLFGPLGDGDRFAISIVREIHDNFRSRATAYPL